MIFCLGPNPSDLQGFIFFLDSMSTLVFLFTFSWAGRNNSKASVVPSAAIQSAASYRRLTVWNPRISDSSTTLHLRVLKHHWSTPTKSWIWLQMSRKLNTAFQSLETMKIRSKQPTRHTPTGQVWKNGEAGLEVPRFSLHFTGQLKQLAFYASEHRGAAFFEVPPFLKLGQPRAGRCGIELGHGDA